MENKLKQLFYVATGWVVANKEDLEIIIEELIKEHPELRDKGKETIDDIVEKSNAVKANVVGWADEFGNSIQGEAVTIKEDIKKLVHDLLSKPKGVKDQIVSVSTNISNKSKATFEEVYEWAIELKEEIEHTQLETKNEIDKRIDAISSRYDHIKDKTSGFLDDLKTESESIKKKSEHNWKIVRSKLDDFKNLIKKDKS